MDCRPRRSRRLGRLSSKRRSDPLVPSGGDARSRFGGDLGSSKKHRGTISHFALISYFLVGCLAASDTGKISLAMKYRLSNHEVEQPRCGAQGTFARSSAEVSSIRMAVVLRRGSSNAAAHLKFLEDRAPLPGKLGELNADESSLDRGQAAPFFVRHSAL
jgi:hypothetical protein